MKRKIQANHYALEFQKFRKQEIHDCWIWNITSWYRMIDGMITDIKFQENLICSSQQINEENVIYGHCMQVQTETTISHRSIMITGNWKLMNLKPHHTV